MAMLFITHDLGIVRRLADRVCVMTARRDRRSGHGTPKFSELAAAQLHHICSRPSRGRSARQPMREDAPVIVRTDEPARLVSDQAAVSSPDRRPHQGGRWRERRSAQGTDARRRRQIRLRQDDARPRDPARFINLKDQFSISAPISTGLDSAEMRPLRQGHADRLPGSLRLALRRALSVGRNRRGRPVRPEQGHVL